MSDPGRLFDESDSELERTLLGVARAEKCSPRARAKTLAALGITGSALSAAALTAAATPLSLAGKTWIKLVLGLSALGAVAITPPIYRAWQRRHAAASAAAAASSAAPVLAAASAPAPAAAIEPTFEDATGDAAGAASLTRELGALDAARAAAAGGQARRALRLLDAYARDFPEGRLSLEAEILRIDAFARSGHADRARHRAEAFLQRHPRSVLAARARQYVED
jgi:hypothetical protein